MEVETLKRSVDLWDVARFGPETDAVGAAGAVHTNGAAGGDAPVLTEETPDGVLGQAAPPDDMTLADGGGVDLDAGRDATDAATTTATADAPHPLASAIVLLGASPRHRHLFIGDLDWAVLPPIALKQFRVFAKDGRPLAYGCWAFVSDEVDARLKTGQIKLKPNEWQSGAHCWLIDIVAPMGGVAAFTKLLTDNVLKDQTVRLSAAVQFAVKSEAARAVVAEKEVD